MGKGLTYWMIRVLNKEINRTEMYFILDLEKTFTIEIIKAKKILDGLMDKRIKNIAVFTRYKLSYTLNLFEYNGIQKIMIKTSKKYFHVIGDLEEIFEFMNNKLRLIKDFRIKEN